MGAWSWFYTAPVIPSSPPPGLDSSPSPRLPTQIPLPVSASSPDSAPSPSLLAGMAAAAALAVSLLLYLAERGAECAVIVHYFLSAQCLWAGWTLALLIPGCLIQALSFVWYRTDGYPQCFSLGLAHIFQLGIFKRHVDCIRALYQIQGEGTVLRDLLMKEGDLSMLRFMEALLQALPHALLQTYIYLSLEQTDAYAVASALVSLLSLSWALVSYSRFLCLLKPGHLSMPWASLLCQLLWRMGMIGTRAMSLVVFARVYHFWVFAVAGAHWLVMSFWLVAQQTDVVSRPCHWRLFNVVLGAVYVFCFINVKSGHSRYRVAIFYVVMLLENSILLLLATDFLQEALWSNVKLSVAVMSGFLIGSAALIVYYTLLHPKSTEISQSFSKMPRVSRVVKEKPEDSAFSSGFWNGAPRKDKTIGTEELKPDFRVGDQEMVADDERLSSWLGVPDEHHHWLFLKLAMKTGNLSKISVAFGDGGFAHIAAPGCLADTLDVHGKPEPPMSDHLEQLMGNNLGCEGSLREPSTYVSLGNTRTEDRPGRGTADGLLSAEVGFDDGGRLSTGVGEAIDDACSPSSRGGARDSTTMYFSANMEGILPSARDPESVLDVPDTGSRPFLANEIKEFQKAEAPGKEEIPVICVSPILSLAANSNFQRSVAMEVGSLCDGSTLSQDDSDILETEDELARKGFHLLSSGVLPPSLKGRLIQEEKPCFTSTPKAQPTSLESGLHGETKARRKLA
ncbi:XK-related protein 5 [Pelodytes ibericus]